MLSLFTPLLLLLAVPTLTNAAIFVPFDSDHISNSYGEVIPAVNAQWEQNVLTLQACIDFANARTGGRGPTGYFFVLSNGLCMTFTA